MGKIRHFQLGFATLSVIIAGIVFVVGSLVVGVTVKQVLDTETSVDTRSEATTSCRSDAECDAYTVCQDGQCINPADACLSQGATCMGQSNPCCAGLYCDVTCKSSQVSSCSTPGSRCCSDPRDYSVWCDGGLLVSNSNPTSCVCQTPAQQQCQVGQRECTNSILKTCKSDLTWNETPCSYGCDPASSAPRCADPPSTGSNDRCLDPCSTDSDCGLNQYCYQPSDGCPECRTKTTSSCVPDSLRCKDDTYVERCTVSGSWIAEKCDAGCNQTTNRCNTPNSSSSLLPNTSPCTSNSDCQSNNCQSVPGGRICLAAGQQVGEYSVTKEGDYCGSTSFGTYSCDSTLGLKCVEGKCYRLRASQESCTTSNQCQSGNCQLTPNGRLCLAAGMTVSTKVAAGGTCATTAYNRECIDGYTCSQNVCISTPQQPPTNLNQLANSCAINPNLPVCQTFNQQAQTYADNFEEYVPQTPQEVGIAALQLLNTATFGTFGNYVASNVDQNATYGYGTDSYNYWDRVNNYENWRAATEFGGVVAAYGVGGYTLGSGLGVAQTMVGANVLLSTSNTAAVCLTPEDLTSNPLCQMAAVQTATSIAGVGSLGTSTAAKITGLAANAIDTGIGAYNTTTYCLEYGVDGTCLLFGATTGLGAIGTAVDAKQVNSYLNQQIDDLLPLTAAYNSEELLAQRIQNIDKELQNLRESIRNEISINGAGNVTVTKANEVIDELMALGMSEKQAITVVGSGITPDYAVTSEQKALLKLADKARTADDIMMCSTTWCRHNAGISDAIAESRGLNTYRAAMTFEGGGGHHTTAILDNLNNPTFLDITNNMTFNSVEEMMETWKKNNLTINYLNVSAQYIDNAGQAAWNSIDLIKN